MSRTALSLLVALVLGVAAPTSAQIAVGRARPAFRAQPIWPAWVAVHRALRLPQQLVIEGRVERGMPPAPLPPGAPPQRRLLTTLRLLTASGLPGVAVALELVETANLRRQTSRWVAPTDDSGYFSLHAALPTELPASLVRVSLRAPAHEAIPHLVALREVVAGPGLVVVSDIDDTLLDSRVRERASLLVNTLWARVDRQRPFVGAAALLSQLAGAPLFYLSGSPQALSERLEGQLLRYGFPLGSLMLKRLARDPLTDQLAYKLPRLLALVDSLPERRFLLLGDSGEQDPEAYAELARRRPGRVVAILIHRVTSEPPAAPRFTGQLLFDDYSDASVHLRRLGLL